MKRLLFAGLATLLVVPGAVLGPANEAGATAHTSRTPPEIRVMPLGDSITAGVGSSTGNGYRLPLRELVAGQSRYTVRFVGSQRSGDMPNPENEGHSGYMIDDIRLGVDDWLAAARPDVVLLHIGINDLDRGTDKAHAANRLKSLVEQIFTDEPGVAVILQGLIPTTDGLENLVQGFNDQAGLLEPVELRVGRHLRFVDAPELTGTDFTDRLHPSDSGYLRMAQAFFPPLDQAYTDGWLVARAPAPGGDSALGSGSLAGALGRTRRADFAGDGRTDRLVIGDSGSVRAFLDKGGESHGGRQEPGRVTDRLSTDRGLIRSIDVIGHRRALR